MFDLFNSRKQEFKPIPWSKPPGVATDTHSHTRIAIVIRRRPQLVSTVSCSTTRRADIEDTIAMPRDDDGGLYKNRYYRSTAAPSRDTRPRKNPFGRRTVAPLR